LAKPGGWGDTCQLSAKRSATQLHPHLHTSSPQAPLQTALHRSYTHCPTAAAAVAAAPANAAAARSATNNSRTLLLLLLRPLQLQLLQAFGSSWLLM
jgi:hypothetical protein